METASRALLLYREFTAKAAQAVKPEDKETYQRSADDAYNVYFNLTGTIPTKHSEMGLGPSVYSQPSSYDAPGPNPTP